MCAVVVPTRQYNTGDSITADYYNADRDEVIAGVNSVVDAQVAVGAAIQATKIADTALTTTATQTATNKTFTAPIISGSAGAAPTVEGQVMFDSTAKQLKYGNGTTTITVGQQYRAFTWYIDGTAVVQDEVGGKYIVPQNMTVTKIMHKLVSGTATIRVQKDTTDVDASISVTSSVGTETSITSAALTAGQVMTLDVTAASSPVGLTVIVECLQS